MVDNAFSFGGKSFKVGKIDAFKQFHIVRRLGPILGDIIPIAQKLKGLDKNSDELSEQDKFDKIAELISPIMGGIAKLSDEDANLVLLGLCSAVELYQDAPLNCWAPISDGKHLRIQTLELPELLMVAGKAFAFNLTSFFRLAPQASHGG